MLNSHCNIYEKKYNNINKKYASDWTRTDIVEKYTWMFSTTGYGVQCKYSIKISAICNKSLIGSKDRLFPSTMVLLQLTNL